MNFSVVSSVTGKGEVANKLTKLGEAKASQSNGYTAVMNARTAIIGRLVRMGRIRKIDRIGKDWKDMQDWEGLERIGGISKDYNSQ